MGTICSTNSTSIKKSTERTRHNSIRIGEHFYIPKDYDCKIKIKILNKIIKSCEPHILTIGFNKSPLNETLTNVELWLCDDTAKTNYSKNFRKNFKRKLKRRYEKLLSANLQQNCMVHSPILGNGLYIYNPEFWEQVVLINVLRERLNHASYKKKKLNTHSYIQTFKIDGYSKSIINTSTDETDILKKLENIERSILFEHAFYNQIDPIYHFIYKCKPNLTNNSESYDISDGSWSGISIDQNNNDHWYATSCLHIEFDKNNEYHMYPVHDAHQLSSKYSIQTEQLTNGTISNFLKNRHDYTKNTRRRNVSLEDVIKTNKNTISLATFLFLGMEGTSKNQDFNNMINYFNLQTRQSNFFTLSCL